METPDQPQIEQGMPGALYRGDAESNAPIAELEIGDGPLFVAAGKDSVWYIKSYASVVRVDGALGSVVAKMETGLRFRLQRSIRIRTS